MPDRFKRGDMIIWDWNGTLLNDIDICIESINRILDKRGLKRITKEIYLRFFRFPVIDFYRDLGFDFEKENFDALSDEYISHYISIESFSALHDGALDLLKHFHSNQVHQVVLSAMEQNTLTGSIQKYNIHHFFREIIGVSNFFGHGKLDSARHFIENSSIPAFNITLLGDTIHDHEVAKTLGCNCILIAGGHQPYEKLITTGVHVEKNLTALFSLVTNS
jgi:phosphoglycolate phosphatase